MKLRGGTLLCAVVGGSLLATQVQAGCWASSEAEAARVRELQTMLMVATLKCQAAGIDISAPYNGFVNARRQVLEGVNGQIKRHFLADGGQAAYDRFVTVLANGYGAAETTAESCGRAAQLAVDAADDRTDLVAVSAAWVAAPTLAGALCAPPRPPVATASAAPAIKAATSVATLASTAADKPPLPAEVVAAMAVIAAYTRDQGGATPTAQPGVATAMLDKPAAR